MIGMFNENTYVNGVQETLDMQLGKLDELGTEHTYNHFAAGWAVAGNTPFTWTKIHHVHPFNADGGHVRTNIDELTPVCGHCHDLAHHPDWHFDKLPDGSTITRAPDGTRWRRWPDRQRPAQPPPAATTHPGTTDQPAATLFTHAA